MTERPMGWYSPPQRHSLLTTRNPAVDTSLTQNPDQTTSPVHPLSRNPPDPGRRAEQQSTGKSGHDMQQERYISTTRMIAVSLWVTVAALLVASWALIFLHRDAAAYMLAITSGVLAPAAGVAHIKVYWMQLSNLIRVTSGLQRPTSGPSEETVLHRVH